MILLINITHNNSHEILKIYSFCKIRRKKHIFILCDTKYYNNSISINRTI